MATGDTRITDVQTTVYAAILEESIQHELRPYDVIRPLLRQGTPGKSQVFTFTSWADPNLSDVQSITEGSTDLITGSAQHRFTTNSATNATAAQKGIMAVVGDFLKTVDILDIEGEIAGLLARSMVEQYETDLIAVGSPTGFTNVTGDTTNPMTMSRHLTAISALEQRDNNAPLAAVYHPKQTGELRADIASTTAAFAAELPQGMDEILGNHLSGYVGSLFNVPVFQTSVVPTSDAAAGRAGFILAVGSALGVYELWKERVELQRDASKVADEVVCTSAYGGAVIDVGRAQLVKTKA